MDLPKGNEHVERSTQDTYGTIRVAERPKYLIIDRRTVRDERLSFRARGALAWMLDQPEGTPITRQTLAKAAPEGEGAMRTVLAELREAGYLVRSVTRAPGGRVLTESILYEVPPDVATQIGTGTHAPEAGNHPPAPEANQPEAGNVPPEAGVLTPGVQDPPTPRGFPTAEAVRLRRSPYPEEFAAAWAAYPRRVGKLNAYKAWLARVRDARPQGIPTERRVTGLRLAAENYAIDCTQANRAVEHIMHPSTFWGPSDRWRDFTKRPADVPAHGVPSWATGQKAG